MSTILFEIRVCLNPQCGMRYPQKIGDGKEQRCPNCRSSTIVAGTPFGQHVIPPVGNQMHEFHLAVLLDNIRSAWNVGSMFRAADGAGLRHLYLCGLSATPENEKVAKTALGSELAVPWSHHMDGVQLCRELKAAGYRIWALEGGDRAEDLYQMGIPKEQPLLLVVGNELSGVDPGILAECERVVCLPMSGQKGSLNVAVAFGIAVYSLRYQTNSALIRGQEA